MEERAGLRLGLVFKFRSTLELQRLGDEKRVGRWVGLKLKVKLGCGPSPSGFLGH